ncbi:MAG: DivIVA domain-containing protein [Bacteroidia bacterium]|nr:DivIVA domain-containing protein [Bacteroidia bacterium]
MINSIEIKQHSFNKSLRGFDTDEVKAYLNSLSVEFEKLQDENRRLKAELDKTKVELSKTLEQLSRFHELEAIMHKTLQQAEQTARSTQETAEKSAFAKIKEAEHKAQDLIQQAYRERTKLEYELNELTYRKTDLTQQMRLFLNAQSERLTQFEQTITTGTAFSHTEIPKTNTPSLPIITEPIPEITNKVPENKPIEIIKTTNITVSTPSTSFFEASLNTSTKSGSLSAEIADEL